MNPHNEDTNWIVLQPDVLGSEQEGWQVNAAYSINKVIRLSDYESDEEVVQALQAAGLIHDGIQPSQIDIDGDEDILYISDTRNWQPLYHLERTSRPMVMVH